MGRHANPDIRRAFQEFQDADTPSKCNKVRCLHCGFVRAKNTTRQIEHLQECQSYLSSPEAQTFLSQQANGSNPDNAQQQGDATGNGNASSNANSNANVPQGPASSSILTGQHPNPNLQVHRRGPNAKRARDGQPIAPHIPLTQAPAPSLTAHLLTVCRGPFMRATQQPFLSHAGAGSLAPSPLSQWLVQDGHYARGYIRFVGQLLGKIRLPQTANSQFHPMYRTMDLLISALNNMRREMSFFEITATKYSLVLAQEPPTSVTRSLLDLFMSASSPSASLLEGMVVLWGTEHCYRSAWQWAATFNASMSNSNHDPHITALHQALIPNWTSPAFSKFVDATRALVDELANSTTARDGREEMLRCEEVFRQICYLAERFWPDVDGMGEDDESPHMGIEPAPLNGSMNGPMARSMNGGDGTPAGDGRNNFGMSNDDGLEEDDAATQ